MNHAELVAILKSRTALSAKEAKNFCDMFFEAIMESLGRGDRGEIRGFGSFTVKEYKGYTGRNPRTGERIAVSPKKLPFFKVGKSLREDVDK